MLQLLYNPIIGVAFWVFLAVVVVAALRHARARNHEKHETVRLALEKGMQLDPALIEALDKPGPARPEGYYVGGFITLAAGLGLMVLAFFMAPLAAAAFYPLIGAGALTFLVGLGLLLTGRFMESRLGRKQGR